MEEVEEKILIKSLIAENSIEQNSKRKFDIDKFIADLQAFIEENGRYPSSKSPNKIERKLGGCVGNLRLAKKGKERGYRLTASMIKKLDAVGFVWDAKKRLDLDEFIKDLNNFIKLNNRYPVYNTNNEDESKLANKVYMLRNARKGKSTVILTEEMINKLDSVGFIWDAKRLIDYDKFIEELQAFIKQHNRYPSPEAKDIAERKLAFRVSSIRQTRRGSKLLLLDETRIKKLDSIGFVWEPKDYFDDFVENLKSFIQEHNRYPLQDSDNEFERKLARQVNRIRRSKKAKNYNRLNDEREKKLDDIGFIWDAQKLLDIDEFINNLLSFIEKNNRYPMKQSSDKYEVKLAGQVRSLRVAKKGKGTNRLTDDMVKKLDAVGFLWEGKKGRRKLNEFEHEV